MWRSLCAAAGSSQRSPETNTQSQLTSGLTSELTSELASGHGELSDAKVKMEVLKHCHDDLTSTH